MNIKFCYKLLKTATETHGMLVHVYGSEAVSRKCVYDWFKRFRDDKETTEDEPRSGRPSTSRTPDMIERVRNITVLDHPPYSPDLVPADFFLFPRMKDVLKGARFADVLAIQERVTSVLRSIPKKAFSDSFQKLYECCQKCVVYYGDYFEGQ